MATIEVVRIMGPLHDNTIAHLARTGPKGSRTAIVTPQATSTDPKTPIEASGWAEALSLQEAKQEGMDPAQAWTSATEGVVVQTATVGPSTQSPAWSIVLNAHVASRSFETANSCAPDQGAVASQNLEGIGRSHTSDIDGQDRKSPTAKRAASEFVGAARAVYDPARRTIDRNVDDGKSDTLGVTSEHHKTKDLPAPPIAVETAIAPDVEANSSQVISDVCPVIDSAGGTAGSLADEKTASDPSKSDPAKIVQRSVVQLPARQSEAIFAALIVSSNDAPMDVFDGIVADLPHPPPIPTESDKSGIELDAVSEPRIPESRVSAAGIAKSVGGQSKKVEASGSPVSGLKPTSDPIATGEVLAENGPLHEQETIPTVEPSGEISRMQSSAPKLERLEEEGTPAPASYVVRSDPPKHFRSVLPISPSEGTADRLEPDGSTVMGLLNPNVSSGLGGANLSTTPEIVRGIATQFADVIQRVPDVPIEVRLSPDELGPVRLTITTQGDAVTLNVQADRVDTLELMRRNIDMLVQDLKSMGFASVSFEFGQGQRREAATKPGGVSAPVDDSSTKPIQVANETGLRSGSAAEVAGGLDLRL